MRILLSPSKTISFDDAPVTKRVSTPVFLSEAALLISKLKSLGTSEIADLMKVNAGLAETAASYIAHWRAPFTKENAKPAAGCFKGAVYTGLDARQWSDDEYEFAQAHVRILSGLYGVLRPLDLIQPYRLEMGLRWSVTPQISSLYAFWGDRIQKEVEQNCDGLIINLASKEYSKAGLSKAFEGRVITPEFKELVGDEYKPRMTYAKQARGTMARFIVQHRLTQAEDLKKFNGMGYAFTPHLSQADRWVFTRDSSAA